MKLWAPVFCAVTLAAVAGASPAAEVGVSVQISQPGVYGRIDIGRFPQPQVVVAQPVVIAPPPVVAAQSPMYLWVPYGHRKHWRKHCHEYNACGVPVYFVRHDWYRDHVMVVARPDHHRKGKGKRGGRDHDDD